MLGTFPLPIEVIPMARRYVAREIVRRGGQPVWRESVVTDNGNSILDVHGWQIADPVAMERDLNQIAGVVTVGLFAATPADIVLIGEREMYGRPHRGRTAIDVSAASRQCRLAPFRVASAPIRIHARARWTRLRHAAAPRRGFVPQFHRLDRSEHGFGWVLTRELGKAPGDIVATRH